MKTLFPKQITVADLPFLYSFGHVDGSVTLYYADDDIPDRSPPVGQLSIECTPVQFRIALLRAGLLDQINDYVAANGRELQIYFEFSPSIRSDHPLIVQSAAALGITPQQIAAVFQMAQTVET